MCAEDCIVGEWFQSTQCNAVCAGGTTPHGGTQVFKRQVVREKGLVGKVCPDLEETRVCNMHACGQCSDVSCKLASFENQIGPASAKRAHILVSHARSEQHGELHKCAYSYTRSRCECLCAKKDGLNVDVAAIEVNKHFGGKTQHLQDFWATKALANMWGDAAALPDKSGPFSTDDEHVQLHASSVVKHAWQKDHAA